MFFWDKVLATDYGPGCSEEGGIISIITFTFQIIKYVYFPKINFKFYHDFVFKYKTK